MNTERAEVICCCLYGLDTAIHPDIPQLDFSASAAAH